MVQRGVRRPRRLVVVVLLLVLLLRHGVPAPLLEKKGDTEKKGGTEKTGDTEKKGGTEKTGGKKAAAGGCAPGGCGCALKFSSSAAADAKPPSRGRSARALCFPISPAPPATPGSERHARRVPIAADDVDALVAEAVASATISSSSVPRSRW